MKRARHVPVPPTRARVNLFLDRMREAYDRENAASLVDRITTQNTAYSLSSCKPYTGQNVVELCRVTRVMDEAAAIYVTRGQVQSMGGTIDANTAPDATIVCYKSVQRIYEHDEPDDVGDIVFIDRFRVLVHYKVYHFSRMNGVSMAVLNKRLARIERREKLAQGERLYQALVRQWPHVPMQRGDYMEHYMAQLFVNCMLDDAYKALQRMMDFCYAEQVTFQLMPHPAVISVTDQLFRSERYRDDEEARHNHVRRKLTV